MSAILKSIRSRQKKKKNRRSAVTYSREIDEIRDTLASTLKEDSVMQAHIKYLYNELYVYILMKLSEKSVIQQLDNYSPDFMTSLRSTIDHFNEIECPIVVAGETSAGKSSLLNVILGEPILPVSLVRATSTVCHIANGESKTVTVVHDDGRTEVFDIKKNKQSLKEAIEKHVLRQPGSSRKEVFIGWPVPFLQGRLTIVDTPGISEPDMAEKVRDILPRAAAFIYVINTLNAGGVLLDGKLFELLKTQSSEAGDVEHMVNFDPRSAIFVLNKWDCVPADEEREVEDMVFQNLQMCWPGLEREQIYKLSAKEVLVRAKEQKGIENVKNHTDRFRKLCYGIESLIPIGLKMNTKSQFRRLWNLVKYLERIVNVRLETARNSQEDKQKEVERLNRRSSLLIRDIKKIMADVRAMLSRKTDEMTTTMFEYFRYPDVIAKITRWEQADAPQGSNITEILKEIDMKVRKRINSELEMFVSKSKFYTVIISDIYKTLEENLQLVDKELKKWENEITCFQNGAPPDMQVSNVSVTGDDSDDLKYIQALDSALGTVIYNGMSFVSPTNYIVTFISMAVKAALEIKYKFELNAYNKDRAGFMAQRTRDALKKLDKDTIKINVVDKMLGSLWSSVAVIERNIPRLIEADKTLINDALNDLRDMDDIMRQYRQPKRFCRAFKAKLILFRIQHFGSCTLKDSEVQCSKRIGSGAYSNVYEATYKNDLVAVKEFLSDDRDASEIYHQCLEIDTLMTLKHKNVVDLYGVIFDDSQPNRQPKLKLVMELCEVCLWDMIQDEKDIDRVPGKIHKSSHNQENALQFYQKTVTQILEGLQYIHSKGYVHRDLKLANILMKNHVIKISDVGMSAAEDDITGTACGTVSHMAPEVISRHTYGQPADIYSLSILMWELWYGKYSYEDYTRSELIDDVIAGQRPNFNEHERPKDQMQKLIKSCWSENPAKRPTAENCLEQMRNIGKGSWSLMSLFGL